MAQSEFWADLKAEVTQPGFAKWYRKAQRKIARRHWFANHVPVLGPLVFRFWLRRSRRG